MEVKFEKKKKVTWVFGTEAELEKIILTNPTRNQIVVPRQMVRNQINIINEAVFKTKENGEEKRRGKGKKVKEKIEKKKSEANTDRRPMGEGKDETFCSCGRDIHLRRKFISCR